MLPFTDEGDDIYVSYASDSGGELQNCELQGLQQI